MKHRGDIYASCVVCGNVKWLDIRHVCKKCYSLVIENEKLKAELAELKINNWVSVKDKKPEYCVDVIGYQPNYENVIFCFLSRESNSFLNSRCRTNVKISHWQSLPEAPRKFKENVE